MFSIAKLGVSFRHFLQWIMHSSALYFPSVSIGVCLCVWVCVCVSRFWQECRHCSCRLRLTRRILVPRVGQEFACFAGVTIFAAVALSSRLGCSLSLSISLPLSCPTRSYRSAGKWMHLYLIKIFYLLHCVASPGVDRDFPLQHPLRNKYSSPPLPPPRTSLSHSHSIVNPKQLRFWHVHIVFYSTLPSPCLIIIYCPH